jgi:uridine kinase
MKTIVAIDGIDGSGKSTFAKNLAVSLADQDCKSVIISVDDFRRPIAWDTLTIPEVDAYYDAYYDLELAEQCLRAFLAGECHVTIPRYDLSTERIDGTRRLDFTDAQVAIVEGVFPLRIPSVRTGLLVFLAVSPTEARRRIIARDMKKGRTKAETERRIDRRYFSAQQRYHHAFDPPGRADVVIANETPASPQVTRRELARVPQAMRELFERAIPR